MADLATYQHSFAHAKLPRSPEGAIEVVLHTSEGSLIFNGGTHEELEEKICLNAHLYEELEQR
jgi:hypothetical protein